MNDKEQVLLGFDLLFGVGGSAFLLAALYLRFTVGSLGYESLVYGLAAVVSVGVTLAALLLVRHRVTSWEITEPPLEEIRAVIGGSLAVLSLLFRFPKFSSQPARLLTAVGLTLFAASATVLLCAVIYKSVRATPERRHVSSGPE
jgi:hypothetical protein